ncbi:HNH endonuclease [Streptomyces sp. NPDC058700]|uniref:HNH endonuclease n=1 Tax=Streptomyces sp. NPDC058700 TaxID=3346607 RepID=UPI0036482C10
MTVIDFPTDPALVAAVEEVFTRYAIKLAPVPPEWNIGSRKRKSLASKDRNKKRSVLARRDGAHCTYCGTDLTDLRQATIDHVIPYRLVRSWASWNLALACKGCNEAKDDHIPAVLMPLLAHLVYRIAVMNGAPVERSLVPAKVVTV